MGKIATAVLVVAFIITMTFASIMLAPTVAVPVLFGVANQAIKGWNAVVPVVGRGINIFCDLPGVSPALEHTFSASTPATYFAGTAERNPLCLPEIPPQLGCFIGQLVKEIYWGKNAE